MQKGVLKVVSEVFHFPEIPHDPEGLSDFHRPHKAVNHPPGGPSLTRQDMAADCDINVIMERNPNVGVLPHIAGEPYYADFTSMPSTLQEGIHLLSEAQEAFMTLPAKVRREFDNDPATFVDYASDAKNLDRMREWGLAPPAKPSAAASVAASGVSAPVPAPAPAAAAAPSPAPVAAGS